MTLAEFGDEIIVPEPVYLLIQREAVQVEDGRPIVLDPGFLLRNEVMDQSGISYALLVYLNQRGAEIFLAWKKDPALTVGVFRELSDLASYLERASIKWIILNKIPGENDGYLIRARHFVDQIRKRMADGT